jgi:predicted Zn-dependent peptidase
VEGVLRMVKYFFTLLIILNTAFAGGYGVIKNILPNGTTILYKQTEGLGIISGTIFIKGGSIEDPAGKKGLTNILMKMILKKTKNYSNFEINKVFEDSGGGIVTSTGEEFSTIEFSLKVEDFEKGMKIIKDILFNPVFEEDKLNQEINNTIAQIEAKKEEGFSYAFDKLKENLYKGTPYQYSPLGEIEDLKTITTKDLKKRLNELLNSKRFIVSIVGDMPYKEAEKYIKEVFEKLPEKNYSFPEYKAIIKGEKTKEFKREGAQSTILVAYNAPTPSDEDFFAFKVLNSIIGNGFTSRLFQELREKRGLAYAVGSVFPTRINIGNLIAYIGTAPEKTDQSLKGIREVIKGIENGVSDEEVKIAKEKIIGNYLLDLQTRSKQSYYIGYFEVVGLGYKMYKDYVDKIQKVSKKAILEAYKKYIPQGNFAVVIKP